MSVSLGRRFDKRLRQTVGFHAVFPPGLPVQIGDVLLKRNGTFDKAGQLTDFGIRKSELRTRPISAARVELATQGVSSKTFQGGVEVAIDKINANAKAELKIDFNGRDSFLFKTNRLTGSAVDNVFEIGMKLKRNKDWRFKQFFIVFQVFKATDYTFMGSLTRRRSTIFSGLGKAVFKYVTVGASAGLSRSGTFNAKLDVFGDSGAVGFAVARIQKSGIPKLDV